VISNVKVLPANSVSQSADTKEKNKCQGWKCGSCKRRTQHRN